MPERRTARENARLEIGSQRGRNSHQIGVLGIYDLQGLSYDRTELLVAGMRLLAPDPSGSPPAGFFSRNVVLALRQPVLFGTGCCRCSAADDHQHRPAFSLQACSSMLGPGRKVAAHCVMPKHADAEARRLTALEAWWHEDPV